MWGSAATCADRGTAAGNTRIHLHTVGETGHYNAVGRMRGSIALCADRVFIGFSWQCKGPCHYCGFASWGSPGDLGKHQLLRGYLYAMHRSCDMHVAHYYSAVSAGMHIHVHMHADATGMHVSSLQHRSAGACK